MEQTSTALWIPKLNNDGIPDKQQSPTNERLTFKATTLSKGRDIRGYKVECYGPGQHVQAR